MSDDATTREGDGISTPGCYMASCPLGHATDVICPHDSCDLEDGVRDVAQIIATLAAEVERLKGEAEEARANLLLQTICRLPSVLTTDDWQAYLDEHRHEWLNDDRAFGGWVSQRLSVAIATARAETLREVRSFVRDIATNWDHDNDSHRLGTPCRMCEAEKLLALLDEGTHE